MTRADVLKQLPAGEYSVSWRVTMEETSRGAEDGLEITASVFSNTEPRNPFRE